jgi:methionine--tRNA ligase beta chain
MAVLHPLRVVITNFPEGETRELEAPLHPDDPAHGARKVPFSRVVYVERDDFREDPPKEFFRLAPGREVRLRYACLIRCVDVVKDARGEVVELRCTWDPASWGGSAPDGRKVQGTLHWVSAAHAVTAEVRLYDRLFSVETPQGLEDLNAGSLVRIAEARLEPFLGGQKPGARFQFERLGYFCADPEGGWNRTVTLKDTWAKIEAKAARKGAAAGAGEAAAAKKPAAGAGAKALPAGADGSPGEITIDELGRADLRVGIVREASAVDGAEKLIRLLVDVGEGRLRQIFTGLRQHYPVPAVLVGKRVAVVANLKPRQMKFGLSEGMILAGGGDGRPHRIVTFDDGPDAPKPGDKIS